MGRLHADIAPFRQRHRHRRRLLAAICLLGLVVVATTSTLMRLPAFTQQKPVFCGLEEHRHTSECLGLGCDIPEHTHDLSCYSNPNADVQTEDDWLSSLPLEHADTMPEQIVAIARSQLGQCESEHNYQVRDDGSVAGYTRYGTWDGDPYEDWNSAFVSFCLEYAGVGTDLFPREADADAWIETLAREGLYENHAVSPYFPLKGDLAFLAGNDGRTMVGVVQESNADAGTFEVVVGDWGNAVCEATFDVRDANILGFGRLPDEVRPLVQPGGEEASAAQPGLQPAAQPNPPPTDQLGSQPAAQPSPSSDSQPAEQPDSQSSIQSVSLAADVANLHVMVEAMLPADTAYRLVATPVSATSEQIALVEECQSQELSNGVRRRAHVSGDLLLLDLSILDESGNKVEPQEEAKVVVGRAQAPDALVHFGQGVVEPLEAQEGTDGFSFETDGFSLFAFAFTVDFYYEGYEYHLEGGSDVSLSHLFEQLGIADAPVNEVAGLSFSDPSLVEVKRQDGDWTLHSVAPFDTEETLVVTMANGDVYSIRVTDAKSYYFKMNVNDSLGGYVYERSTRYGSEIVEAVTDSGVAASWVRPRSADEPTSTSLSATRGYHFIGWRVDGYLDYGMGRTGEGVARGDTYAIQPSTGEELVSESWHTFTACFVPDDQYMVTFDKYVWADEEGRVNGYVQQGGAMSYTYLDDQKEEHEAYFCYSESASGALAVPNYDSKFVGWYQSGTNNLVCESASFVAPANLSDNITVQARFVKAAACTVRYYSRNAQSGGLVGDITITGSSITGKDVSEQVYEQHVPSGAVAADYGGYTFVAWRDAQGHILTRDHELANLPVVTQDVEYHAEYLATTTKRVLFTVRGSGTGKIMQGAADKTDAWLGWNNVTVDLGGCIVLKSSVTAVPNGGFRFDHWELNGTELTNRNQTIDYIDKPISNHHIQELTAVFVPICSITFDLGVIQQVGNNAADFQHWESVPWCSKDVSVDAAGLADQGNDRFGIAVDYGSTFALPDLVHNNPAGDTTIRVSQTNNGYNLLTHTFRGWRVQGGDGTVYPVGTQVVAEDSVTYEAVWDAYLPGKAGYYGSGSAMLRFNTNTCGFFVRLFDSTFDIGDTNTYTDCLFTSRIFLGGDGAFATVGSNNGRRMDFFGNSEATNRDQIDEIDRLLRENANTFVPYSEQHSGQSNGNDLPGSTITFEQDFPSDEFVFARIRAWNASISEDRKIRINGTLIPQEKLTPDYFDLRWYVLKDQENSWHVDGMLIPKYAKLVVTKRFEGSEEAIRAVKNGNFYIGVTRDKSKTENTSLSEEYKLRLHWHTNQDGNDDLGYYLDENGTYTWVVDTLEPLSTYWVAEHYFTAQIYTQVPYATARSIHVSNTLQNEVDVGDSNCVELESVYSYPDDATIADIQTISFTNRYTQPREITLVKQDASSGGPIEGASFTFTLFVDSGGQTVPLSLTVTTDAAGTKVISIPTYLEWNGAAYSIPDGTYRFQIDEQPLEGYQQLPGSITGSLELSGARASHITLDSSVTGNPSLARLVELGEVADSNLRSLIYVKNEPRTKNVTVTKHWTNGATTPVIMQLLRNEVPVSGVSVQLSPANNWTATWEGLPAYVDGAEVIYTVREEWIGEAGGTDSVHYNASADADGYEDYIVSQSQSVAASGDVSVYVENTPNSGQVVFSKVDDSKRAVAGAEFTVYSDADCKVPITAADFVTDPGKQRPSVFASSAEGMVTIEGLNPGTYYLRETFVPSGYVLGDTRTYTLTVGSKSSSIIYANNSGEELALTQVVNPVYSREVTIRKVITGTVTPLSGAVFSLHGSLDGGGMDPTPLRGFASLVSGEDGRIALGRLRQGVYYLVEESAPTGFNRLESAVRITVPDSDSVSMTAIKVASNTGLPVSGGTITVSNSEGTTLPATGGHGTAWTQAVGYAVALAATVLVVRRLGAGGGDRS